MSISCRAFLVVGFLAAFGCGGGSPVGTECASTSECQSGLSCIDIDTTLGGGCTLIEKACSKVCSTNADCGTRGDGTQASCGVFALGCSARACG